MNKNPIYCIINGVRGALASIIGTFNWQSPAWMKHARQHAKKFPFIFWSCVCLFIVLISVSIYTIHWYKNLPKPVAVSAEITVPDITPNNEEFIPNNLIIDFGIKTNEFIKQSVAPLNLIGKNITEGITLTPQMEGTWSWNSDSQLMFIPAKDWPAGQKYTIHVNSDFFAPNVNIESHDFSFSTKPFKASISEFKFYQDPVKADVRNAVATILFNYPVDTESLEKNTYLAFQALRAQGEEPIRYSYTYDKNKRIAYLHSANITIKDVARYVLLTLNKKILSSTGSAELGENLSQSLLIPDATTVLKITAVNASIVRNDKDKPEQLLNIETSIGVNELEFNKAVHIYLLPIDYPATATEPTKPNYSWQNPGEVTTSILSAASPLTKVAISAEHNYSQLHSFKFNAQTPRYLYVKIDKGMKGFGDFILNNDYATVIPVPEYPKEITFLHKGSLLALSSEKKLSVMSRGVPAVKFDFARVLPENVNQLVTQTQGDFNNPYFINPSFNQQNISQIFSEIIPFEDKNLSNQQYRALDLGKYLNKTANSLGPQGLFLLQATGWDVANKYPLDVKSSRLILITDIGMIVKDNNDGSHDVFVTSITQGGPIADVKVTVLGKNGLPILERISDGQGRVNFPTLKDFVEDREPTVYIAQQNQDVSFIPFNNYNRQLNFSKFDIGGLYSSPQDIESLSAYLFSDRGIYRPGDTAHIGMIVKQAYARSLPSGLPLQARVIDSRGNTIKDQKITLNDLGFLELDVTTSATSPTGQYLVELFSVKDEHPQNLLGSTSINIAEFQPDKMRISSHLIPEPNLGWNSPTELKAYVNLWNLYGQPATERKVSAKIILTPHQVKFDQFPDYIFADPLIDPKKPTKVFTEDLNNLVTNEQGQAEFNLHLERFERATYQLSFFAEGFEAAGGRSVTTQVNTLVSPLPYFVGYKSDGDLSFIKQNSQRNIHYIAVNPQLSSEEVNELKIQCVSLHPVTTLIKKPDGTYQYQSIIQSSIINSKPFAIHKQGTNVPLPTDQIGNYSLNILNKNNEILSQLKFSIVGASQQTLAQNAELSIKLNKEEYLANEDIEIQITAPYTGSGLITIERDKVYATQWFKTETTNSIQTIRVPGDFKGNGYINVAFVRDFSSPELFISPLSYSVAPFSVNHQDQKIQIDLKTPEVVRPGETLTIDYRTNKSGKIIVSAVDEGVLQVAGYDSPDPLAFFFQKHALQVLTQQTVDQILPQFIQSRELSAAGGDDSMMRLAARLNPFKRKTDLPVVYWSGIIDTDTSNHQLTYQVPDYFNGTLRIMAVAVAADALGSNDTKSLVRGDFIINPNVPSFVAPGDEFEISASIANNVKDSGEHAPININVTTSPELEIIGASKQTLEIAEGREQPIKVRLKANTLLGSAKISISAQSGTKSSTRETSLSVRPATAFITDIKSGTSNKASLSLNISNTFYPEFYKATATYSTNPLLFVFGLERYLEHFPYGCTEQLTSKALPLLAMNSQPWFANQNNSIKEKINAAIQMLSLRQMSQGGFSYWPGFADNPGNTFASVYAMHFLTEAKAQGFNVPADMFANGMSYLKQLASQNATDKDTARIQAYAIYILTRNEIVTTNYLANLLSYLEKDATKSWQKEIIGVYVAASFQMLKSTDDANKLIGLYETQNKNHYDSDFYDSFSADAQYIYIVAKHFPNLLPQVGEGVLQRLINAMNNNEINTILAGYGSLALAAYPELEKTNNPLNLSMTQIMENNQLKNLPTEQANYQQIDIEKGVKQVRFNNPNKETFFYQLIQSGFDKTPTNIAIKQGLEINREYRDAEGNIITSTTVGNEIEVHIKIRALNNDYLTNIAILDLLPGGFEVVRDSVKSDFLEYTDVREDRVNFFMGVDSTVREIVYKIKAINAGTYIVPPSYAESMYNPLIKASNTVSQIQVLS